MKSLIFRVLVATAYVLPVWFVGSIWRDRLAFNWNWISKDTRTMYVDAVKSLTAVCAVAVSIVVSVVASGNRPRPDAVINSVRTAVIYLIVSVVASIATVLALSRGYDRARSRFLAGKERQPHHDTDQGQVSDGELLWILIPACICLIGFLVGFLYLGRIAFQI